MGNPTREKWTESAPSRQLKLTVSGPLFLVSGQGVRKQLVNADPGSQIQCRSSHNIVKNSFDLSDQDVREIDPATNLPVLAKAYRPQFVGTSDSTVRVSRFMHCWAKASLTWGFHLYL
jgi:hypothetical protein